MKTITLKNLGALLAGLAFSSVAFAGCFTGTISANGSGGNWYTPVNLVIKNTCTTPQPLNGVKVNFANPNGTGVNSIGSAWGDYSGASFSQTGFTLVNNSKDPIAANATTSIQFGVNTNGIPFNVSAANSSLTLGGNSAGNGNSGGGTTIPDEQVIETPVPAGCIAGTFTVSAPKDIWYTNASLKITNHCGSTVNLNKAHVSFAGSNVASVQGPWHPLKGVNAALNAGVISFALEAQTTDAGQLANGASTTLTSIGFNMNGKTAFANGAANYPVSITPANAAAPTPNDGKINVTLNPAGVSGLPAGTNAKITISSNALAQPIVINNSNWVSTSTHSFNSLGYAVYNIAVEDPPGFIGTATPASITLGNSTAANVSVTYKVAPAVGHISVTLPTKPISALTDAGVTINVTDISNSAGNASKFVNYNQTATFNNLPAGDTYQISLTPVSISDGVQTATPVFSANHFKLLKNTTQAVHVNFQLANNPTTSVVFNVSGLTAEVSSLSLNLTNLQGVRVGSIALNNGSKTIQLPVNNTYTPDVNASPLIGSINPSVISTMSGSVTTPVTISVAAASGLRFMPYFDNTVNADWSSVAEGQPADLSDYMTQTGANGFVVAFITDAGTCQSAWAGVASLPATVINHWGANWFNSMKAKGAYLKIAFGGASGTDLSVHCSATDLISQYQAVINAYKPSALDFDIEGGLVANPTAYNKIMLALQTIQAQNPNLPIAFTLPVMPDGLDNNGRAVVTAAKNANLKFIVNIMAMDYGPSFVGDMGGYAISASEALFSFLKGLYPNKTSAQIYQMMAVTPMIGVNDVIGENFTLSDAREVYQYAQQKGLAYVSMWSIARDQSCNDQWATSTCSGSAGGVLMQTAPYQFGKAFSGK